MFAFLDLWFFLSNLSEKFLAFDFVEPCSKTGMHTLF